MGRKPKQGSAAGSSVKEYKIEREGEEELIIKVGDTVLLRPPQEDTPDYVARIESITVERNDVKVKTRWYYRPEESLGGRRNFHGEKELFLSDHYDVCSVDAVMGLCTVHSFKNYVRLESVEPEDFFCRFEYRASNGTFKPDYVAVYCVCEMPYNPDDLMVQCDACRDWFHPKCIKMSPEAAKELSEYTCGACKKEGKQEADEGQGDGEIEEDKEQVRPGEGNANESAEAAGACAPTPPTPSPSPSAPPLAAAPPTPVGVGKAERKVENRKSTPAKRSKR